MYRINNPYRECHITELNLMHVHEYKDRRITISAVLFTISPLVLCALVAVATFLPELGFMAECQNIPGGDICTITLK